MISSKLSQSWKKLGLIFKLKEHSIPWAKSHAMLPSPVLLDDVIRVYITVRDTKGQSRITFVDLDPENPKNILYVHDQPLLELGQLGTFDDSGTLGACAVRHENQVYLYYNGYNRRVTVPWSNAIGLATSQDGGKTFRKIYEGPIVDRNEREPYFVVSPCVIRGPDQWHMWYTSGTGWTMVNEKPEPLYEIKYAQSADGIQWKRDNLTCIQPAAPDEANARAAVSQDEHGFKMWFCYRGSKDFRDGVDSYRLGYAEAKDPVHWSRQDEKTGINNTDTEWDSKMQAYPSIISVKNRTYLFYNGNGFGAEGFGCAVWSD